MSTAITKRLESFAVPGGLRGTFVQLPLPELLRELSTAGVTGILSVVAGGARKALYLRGGRVVFAASNLPSDRLGEFLLREGRITSEQNEASARALPRGKRQGKALVEMGVLTPDELWRAVQSQVRDIVLSVFQWDEGQFRFEPSPLPERERITVDLDVVALILEGLRRVDAAGALRSRYPDGHLVLERAADPPGGFLPYERHVLDLVDGERSVLEICHESEVGDNETLKVLYALLSTGLLRIRGRKARALDQDFVSEDTTLAVLEGFNRMFRLVFAHMAREVGPIAESVLEKYLGGVREARPEVLQGARLRRDGALEEAAVERNLGHLLEGERRGALIDALNEILYAELLAVKRTLGPEHEATIVRTLRG